MGKWLNGARVRKRGNGCSRGADRRSGACGNGRAVCPGAARVEPGPKRSNQYLKRGIAPTGVIYMHIR